MKEIEIEKLRQIVSRTDKSGNEKVEMLIKFTEDYHFAQMQLKNNCIKSDVSNRRELLISFLQWFFNNETNIDGAPETKDFVDIYLKTNL